MYVNLNEEQKIQEASTTEKGIVKLNNITNSTSTTEAATANALRLAYSLASSKGSGNTKISTGSYTPTSSSDSSQLCSFKPKIVISTLSTQDDMGWSYNRYEGACAIIVQINLGSYRDICLLLTSGNGIDSDFFTCGNNYKIGLSGNKGYYGTGFEHSTSLKHYDSGIISKDSSVSTINYVAIG